MFMILDIKFLYSMDYHWAMEFAIRAYDILNSELDALQIYLLAKIHFFIVCDISWVTDIIRFAPNIH